MNELQRYLFIDRDGTLIEEPADEQIDSFEKLRFLPGVFRHLGFIARKLDFRLVLVSNQDGLGTPSFPEESFMPVHRFVMQTLASEGIVFDEELIDRTFPDEHAPTRKPGTGMLVDYIDNPKVDMANSYVIGDRLTDAQLADNLGCKSLILGENGLTWEGVAAKLFAGERCFHIHRSTAETSVDISLCLDGSGKTNVRTGLGFFDHMLEQIGRHGMIDLDIEVKGDLHVDEHHTVEDTALALGECLRKALGDKRGIERYGFTLPMDDCLSLVALDFGGRPWMVWEADFNRERIGDVPTELFYHFFKSLSDTALMNLHIRAMGINEHHKIEGIFKAFGRALRNAVRRDLDHFVLPTTKGLL